MGGSNSVEPLSKSEKELKIRPLSVRAGAQNSKHVWLTNDTRNGPKTREMKLTLEDKPLATLGLRNGAYKLLESSPSCWKWKWWSDAIGCSANRPRTRPFWTLKTNTNVEREGDI